MTERMKRVWLGVSASKWALPAMICAVGLGIVAAWAADVDDDGIDDSFETFFGLNTGTNDAALDPDADGLDNLSESLLWTDPFWTDTDRDGFLDGNDSNPVSRAFIPWGDSFFTGANGEVLYTWPDWMVGAFKSGGDWDSNLPAWHVTAAESNPASLAIEVDRALLTNDLRFEVGLAGGLESTLYLDLYDTNGLVIVTNALDNLLTGGGTGPVRIFSIPLVSNSAAVGLWLRHGTGEVTVSRSLLYVDVDGDGLDAEQERQLGTSDTLSDSDGDAFSDAEEVFTYGTDPALAASVPYASIAGLITYAGVQTGAVRVVAAASAGAWTSQWSVAQGAPGSYTLWAPQRRVWHVRAYRDVNGNGSRDQWEPSGLANPAALMPVTAATGGVDIALSDPDTDGDGMSDAAEMALGLDPAVSNAYARLPFVEGFETNTVTMGDLNGQHGWRASVAGAAVVQSNKVYAGAQALRLQDTNDTGVTVSQYFVKAATNSVWVDARLVALPCLLPSNGAAPIAGVAFDNAMRLLVFDGHVSGTNRWVALTNAPVVAEGSWARITTRLDFAAQTWLVCLNGVKVAEGLGFGAPVSELHAVEQAGVAGFSDDLAVTAAEPAGLTLDGDSLPDDWERLYFGGLGEADAGDPDGDDLSNLAEYQAGMRPDASDTDGDGMPDGWETAYGLAPTNAADAAQDADGDGLTNLAEWQRGAHPHRADTDGDGLSDGAEVNTHNTNPLAADTDGDDYRDGDEVERGTDPLDAAEHPASHWRASMKIRLRTGVAAEGLAGAPALVRLTPERLEYARCAADGRDILFTDAGGRPLAHEVERWAPGGESLCWVRLPELGDTNGAGYFLMHWDNAEATNAAAPGAVWSAGYAGVWHLGETNNLFADSVGGYTATNFGAVCVPGFIGQARQFRGADSLLAPSGAFAGISNAVTISFWQYGATNQPLNRTCFEGVSGVGRELNAHVPWGDGNVYWDAFGNYDRINKLAATNIYKGGWNHWTFVKDRAAGVMSVYVNGELWHSGTGRTRAYTPVTTFRFGAAANGGAGYTGLLDELRVETVVRTPEWIRFQRRTMSDEAFVYGEQEASIERAADGAEPDVAGLFMVRRAAAGARTNLPLTVRLAVAGGTATAGADYTGPGDVVTIPAGALAAYATVTPLDDLWLEGAETVTVRVVEAGDYTVAATSGVASLTIADDDADTDSDLLCDVWELLALGNLGTLWATDSDGDGLNNGGEYLAGTNPLDGDSDDDGLPDGWEVFKGTNPLVGDAGADPDNDGLTNWQEYQVGSSPLLADTDGDGMPDKWEVDNGFNPANAADAAQDADGDGLTNLQEYVNGANPRVGDTDGDGLGNAAEVNVHRTKAYKADTDGDGMPDKWEVENGTNPNGSDAATDPDGDGLANLGEYGAGTNPLDADTDGDGVNDGAEANSSHSDPLAVDFDGTVATNAVINGADAVAMTGLWDPRGTSIECLSRRGTVEYAFTNGTPGVCRLVVEGSQGGAMATRNSFKILADCDGEYLGVGILNASSNATGLVCFYTPWLTNGPHRLRIEWDNVYAGTILRVNRLLLQSAGGPDGNGNGRPDWIDYRLAGSCSIASTNSTSYVSPLCLEGRAAFVSGMSIAPGGATNAMAANPMDGGRWYADAPLSPTGATVLAVSFEQGALCLTNVVEWVPRNVLDGGSLMVRAGDSVKLSALPAGETSGVMRITVGNATTSWAEASDSVVYEFASNGTWAVTGVFSNGNGVVSNTLQVTALGGGFPTNEPICWWGLTRGWNCPSLPPQAVVESNATVAAGTASWLSGGGRRLSVAAMDGDGPRYLAARIATNGPVLDSRPLAVTWLRATVAGYFYRMDVLSDGTQVTHDTLHAGHFPPTGRIRMNIWTSGAVFEDGTLVKWMDASDLDGAGSATYRMLVAPGRVQVACHSIAIYDGTESVGSR